MCFRSIRNPIQGRETERKRETCQFQDNVVLSLFIVGNAKVAHRQEGRECMQRVENRSWLRRGEAAGMVESPREVLALL